MFKTARNYLAVAFLSLSLIGCGGMLLQEPSNVNKVDQTYLDAEKKIEATYKALSRTADAELAARERGEPKGTVITQEKYNNLLSIVDKASTATRWAYDMSDTECIVYKKDSDLSIKTIATDIDLSDCFSREQAVLIILGVITAINEENGL